MNCDPKSIHRLVMLLAAAALVLSGNPVASVDGDHISTIRVLSSPPDMVSGSEALVQVNVPMVNFK